MDEVQQILKSVYGYDSFRPLQKEIIDHVVSGRDALVLMPTGGGKPTNLFLFGNCFGIGEHKKNQFGERFVDLICGHLGVERSPEPFESVEIHPSPDAIELPIEESNSDKELSYMDKQKQLHANAYAPWSNEEESTLSFLYHQGKTVKELTLILQRNECSIRPRLRKIGLI